MGNKILGKRSRNYYKGFNDRQVDYIKEKFSIMSNGKQLDKSKFEQEYKLKFEDGKNSKSLTDRFFEAINYDAEDGIDEYEFLCAVHSLCNLTVRELGEMLFKILVVSEGEESIGENDLLSFTAMCVMYNGALENKTFAAKEIKKINKDKMKKYDYNKNKSIEKDEFVAICVKDADYKNWFYNMGFITKNQLQFNDQVYDLVDSDVDEEIQRHLTKTDPKMDKLKRGFQNKVPDENDFQQADDEGDQAIPVQSTTKIEESKQQAPKKVQRAQRLWQKQVKKYKINQDLKQNQSSPSQTLTMKYIFGYRSYDCRNNIKFDKKGNIVYHQGSVGIVMNSKNQQFFMNEHKDDIVSLDLNGDLVVTGELGNSPSVLLWNSALQSMKSKLVINEGLKEAVGNVTLSAKSQFLAVNCNDSDHMLVVYELKKDGELKAEIKSTGALSKNAILDLRFTSDSKMIVAASLKQILFVKFDNSVLNASRGEFGQFSSSCALCLLPIAPQTNNKKKAYMLSGMTNGSIYFWQEDKCKKAVTGHNGSVSALASGEKNSPNLLISGDKTGGIFVWGREFEKLYTCSIEKNNLFSNMIVSLSLYSNEVLVATKSSTVYRAPLTKNLILKEKDAIIQGHNEGNLSALSVEQVQNTQNGFFYTGGDDQRLIKWQYGTDYKKVKEQKCKYKIRSLNHNKAQRRLAVGYVNGVIEIFDEDLNFKEQRYDKIKNPDKEILNLVKLSKLGEFLVACYTMISAKKQEDKSTWTYAVLVFPYNASDKALKKPKQIDFTSKVTALDFDDSGQFLRVNTEKLDFAIYDLKQDIPKVYKDSIKIQKMKWHTHTTIISPQTRGFLTEGVEEKDIVCCQRNRRNCNVIMIGDKYSKLKLFNYPLVNSPIFNKYEGHSNAVTSIQFDRGINGIKKDKNDSKLTQFLVTVGGQEKSIIVWQYDPDEINNQDFFNFVEEVVEESPAKKDGAFQEAEGQQAGSVKSYTGQIIQPLNFKELFNPRRDNKLPKQDLQIEHTFGIRNQYLLDEVRNMCKFNNTFDSILFPTACLGVKMDLKSKQQSYFHEHKQDIVSFAIDKSRTLMATGQMAEKNQKDPRKKIVSTCIWDIKTNKLLKKLDGFHTIAVVLLQFSPSGKYLFTVGNDDKNTYAVYDWKAGTILHSGPISGGKVNGIAWKNDNEFITCGNDHVKFWEKGKGRQGKFNKGQIQPMFSCLFYEKQNQGAYITGGGCGSIFVWSGNASVYAQKAHGSGKSMDEKSKKSTVKIQTIVQKKNLILTGADDGLIKLWKMDTKRWELIPQGNIFDPSQVDFLLKSIINVGSSKGSKCEGDEYGILSIDFAYTKVGNQQNQDKNNSLLIVTKGASVITCNFDERNKSTSKHKIVHQGHYKGELWGLATYSQKNQEFLVTGGDDRTVRVWNLRQREQISRAYFQNSIRAVDCSQGEQHTIVAADWMAKLYLMDKRLSKQPDVYTGKPYQTNAESNKNQGKIKFEHCPWVEDVKFSPQGNMICYGTHAKSIIAEVVPVSNGKFQKGFSFKAGTSAVNHIDWSKDGNKIAINTQAWEYWLYSVDAITSNSKKCQVSATSLRDQQWASYTRKYGFQSQGVFQSSDHTDINTLCRLITEPDRDNPKGILAAGYDDQTIRLFQYPCYIERQVCKTYYGHSSHVTKIKFVADKMVSIGGLDRTLIVWNIKGLQNAKNKYKNSQNDDDDGLDDLDEDVDLPAHLFKKKPKPVVIQDFTEIQDEGDEFMAIKPWVGAIKQPTYTYPKSKGTSPNARMDLQYVFGYRTKDCRQNLYYKDEQTVIYHAAAVLIYHNIKENKQTLFREHNDDILCIDYNQKQDIVLTGEIGPKPLVCMYQNGKFQHGFKAPVDKGVLCIGISPKGKYGVCVGLDDEHHIAVLDLVNKKVIVKQKGDKKIPTRVKWISEDKFVVVGINHIATWTFSGSALKADKKNPKSNNISLDCSPDGKMILVGANFFSLYDIARDSSGSKPIWSGGDKGIIQSIKISDSYIICGTRSGEITFFDKQEYSKNGKIIETQKIQLNKAIEKHFKRQEFDCFQSCSPCVRAIDIIEQKSTFKLLVGTLGSQIFEFQMDRNLNVNKVKLIMKGHFTPNPLWTNEVWGLCIPENLSNIMLTCSDDSTIRIWDINYHSLVYCVDINREKIMADPKTKKYPTNLRLRAIAVSPNNKFVAVGAFDGTLRVYQIDLTEGQIFMQKNPVYEVKHAKQWISDIKFGFKTLILGSHDNGIYVYDFEKSIDNDQDDDDGVVKIKLKYKPMKKHSSYITHLDVSRDSCFLQSTCGAYEILFWDLNSGKQLPGGASMLKDQKWKSLTCNLGWPVQGIYPKEQDGTFINAVDRSHTTLSDNSDYSSSRSDFYLLAAGNDHGKVCLYEYPSLVKNSRYVQGKGHSSHVTTVRWTSDDKHLISVGGEDQCVMVWSVEKGVKDEEEVRQPQKKATKSKGKRF